MRFCKQIVAVLLLALPGIGAAELSASGLPATSTWYFHADFDEMRGSDAGKPLYAWLQREVFADVREDAGIDLDKEADEFDTLKHKGTTFYYARSDKQGKNGDIKVDSFENGVYFTFALKNRLVATSSREQLERLLDNKGRLPDSNTDRGTLIVLTAEKSLIQAGIQADQIEDRGDGGWQSNILRNTEQLAVMIADAAGKLAIETRLIATQPEMAESLGSIVRGLISLASFSEDTDPDVAEFLRGTTVGVDGSSLNIRLALDPESVIVALDK